ncbi:MAG: SufE family protein [Pseudomonadota bacterium]
MTQEIPPFDDIADDFAFIDDWDEKYRYIIDLGRRLPALTDAEHHDEHKVRGCASQVWLVFDDEPGKIAFRGDSDAAIVKGLVALMVSLFSGQTKADVMAIDAQAKLAEIDLQEHITPQRSNGVASMIKRIKAEASA